MDDKEILDALKICSVKDGRCERCKYNVDVIQCNSNLQKDAIDLIERQATAIDDLCKRLARAEEGSPGVEKLRGMVLLIRAVNKVVNNDLDCVNNIDGLAESLHCEKMLFEKLLLCAEQKSPTPPYFSMPWYIDRILYHAEPYGWDKHSIAQKIKDYIAEDSLT